MRFSQILILSLVLCLPAFAGGGLPAEMRECKIQDVFTPFFKAERESIAEHLGKSGLSQFDKQRILSVAGEPDSTNGILVKFSNCKEFGNDNELGRIQIHCKSFRDKAEWEALAAKAKAGCEQYAENARKKFNSDSFAISCAPYPHYHNKVMTCAMLKEHLPESTANACKPGMLRGVVETTVYLMPRIVLTNKGADPFAKERRCALTRACVSSVVSKSRASNELKKEIWQSFGSLTPEQADEFCDLQEKGGFAAVAEKLRALGIKFKSDEDRGPTIGAGTREDGPIIGAGTKGEDEGDAR